MTRKNKGFSLIELAVVMIIIALMLGLTMPNMMRSRARSYKDALRQLGNTSRYLQQEAVAQRQLLWFVFDFDKQEWSIEKPDIDYLAGTMEIVPFTDRHIAAHNKLPDGLRLVGLQTSEGGRQTAGSARFAYEPSGFVEPAIFHFEDDGHEYRWSLIIQPLSGFADLSDEFVELAID